MSEKINDVKIKPTYYSNFLSIYYNINKIELLLLYFINRIKRNATKFL